MPQKASTYTLPAGVQNGTTEPPSRASADPPLMLTRDVCLDLLGRRLLVRGQEEPLSRLRFDILRHLLERPGRVVSGPDLVRAGILGRGSEQRYRGVMKEIRDRLGPAQVTIRTVRGVGYRFDPPRSTA